jgi:spore maturation protein CgeB
MRILVAHPGPQFSVHDVLVGWVEALQELGQDVAVFNLHDRLTFYDNAFLKVTDDAFRKALTPDQATELAVNGLAADLYRAHPDVLLVVSGFFIPDDLLDLARAYNTRVVLLHTESPYEDLRQLKQAEHADLNILNDPTNLEAFKSAAPTFYAPHAYRPHIHHPGPAVPNLVSDLAFVGTGYQSRIDFFEAMNLNGLNVLLAGNWTQLADDSPLRKHLAHDAADCLDNEDTVNVYRSAKVGLNLYRREAQADHLMDGWAMGPREVEMAACGLFFLRDRTHGEGDQILHMLSTFDGPEDASQQLRHWLGRDDERRNLADRARQAVADRTFTRSAAEMLRLLTQ